MSHKFTASEILDAFQTHGSDVSYCPDCGEFQGSDSNNCGDRNCQGDSCTRYEDHRYELEVAFERETEAMGKFVTAIAEALGVKEVFGGGFVESDILDAIKSLKRNAA